MKRLLKRIRTFYNTIRIRIAEKTWNGVKYVYYPSGGGKTLLICFSAFPPTNLRLYNNIRGFKNLPVDRLYINDIWGYRGSYYIMEKGLSYPFSNTCMLIERILSQGKYEHVFTAGTSKGGTAAILFGLKYGAEGIFAGACQYHIGDYLNVPEHHNILKAMLGNKFSLEDGVHFLNDTLRNAVFENMNSTSTVHIVYSKRENTYAYHLIDLINDLHNANIRVVEHECFFENHNDVGFHFIPYVRTFFNVNS